MHFEILVEDQSGKRFLEILIPNIVGADNSFKIHSYKGIGRIPKGLSSGRDASKRILLDRLPRLLAGYGKAFSNYPADYRVAVVVVCDLDDNCLKTFLSDLQRVLDACNPKPDAHFCLAIEEGEAWLLGDLAAVKRAYPSAKEVVLKGYVNDSICGTWECLADAVFVGGRQALLMKGPQAVGAEKSLWADKITPHMNIDKNESPSFCYFRDKIRSLLGDANNAV
jgi:hypothetical protein